MNTPSKVSFSSSSHSRLTRRIGPIVIFAVLLGAALSSPAHSQKLAPDAALAELGLPELRVVVTDTGFEAPAEAVAGRTLIVLENQGTPDGPAQVTDVNLLQLPAGHDLAELNDLFAGGEGEAPEWLAEILSTGGFKVAAGETGYGVIDLAEGDWILGAGDTNAFVALTVTGNASDQPDPRADIEIDIQDTSLGLPAELRSDSMVWHLTNSGSQSHEIMLVQTPVLLTVEQVITILTLPEGEDVPAGVPDPATLIYPPDGLQTMSAGREIWIEMSLEPGFYVALCMNPDPRTGTPHAALGEISIFTVTM
ncbi:MAG: hypothetical protein AB7G88_01680 [Thermomicrobiales bacterium]